MSSRWRATIADELRAGVEASVLAPDADGYANAVAGFDLAVVHRPEVVIGAGSVEDVALTQRVAARTGHEVVAMSAGHGQLSAMRSGLPLNLRRLDAVVVDPVTATAVVSGGATSFLDTSRGQNRQWCSSTDCGNRHRVRLHQRRAATRSTDS